jgi:hypothetical protein
MSEPIKCDKCNRPIYQAPDGAWYHNHIPRGLARMMHTATPQTTTNHRATAHTPADYDAAITAIMKAGISGKPYEAALTAIRLAREEAEKHLDSH